MPSNDWQSGIFFVIVLILVFILGRWHSSKDPQFDFRIALIDPLTGRISFSRLGHFVSLVISTLIICFETINGRLSEWLFAGYMVSWAGAYVAAKAIDSNKYERSEEEPNLRDYVDPEERQQNHQ